MTADFWLGLAVLPALGLLVILVSFVRWLVRERIVKLKPGDPQRRASIAARLFASKRAYAFLGRRVCVAVTVGYHFPVEYQAEAVLLDEFVPIKEEASP